MADITIFDYDKLEVTGDAIEPRKHPKGIVHILVDNARANRYREKPYPRHPPLLT